jgi:HlyD family secretion protein
MSQHGIFRQAALDRLASPEQLDQLLPVTDRRGWLALASFAIVILAAGIWSVHGSLPENVTGTGMLVSKGGVLEIVPPTGGRVSEVLVRVGEAVTPGTLVARLEQPAIEVRVKEAKAALRDLTEQHQEMVENETSNLPLQERQLAQQREAAEKSITSAANVRRASDAKIAAQRALVNDGLLLRQTLLETMQRRDAAIERIQEAQSQLAAIDLRAAELRSRREEQESASERKVREATRALVEVQAELATKTEVRAAAAGRILEILAEPGMVLGIGEPVLTLGHSSKEHTGLEAILFVPSVQGKQIRVGMPALISPTTVKQEEHGMIVGRVSAVSEFPTTMRGMQRWLKNDRLAASLSGGDAPYEVRAELFTDPSTPSKFRWSSSKGPPRTIESGSVATARIAVAQRRPIELVIPMLREAAGL